jgi:hypothetical protein
MGELLISGNGKGHSAIVNNWILSLVSGAVLAIMGYYFANDIGVDKALKITMFGATNTIRESAKNEMWYFFMGIAVLGPVLMLVLGCLFHIKISKMSINVHENGIDGQSSSSNLPIHYAPMSEFQLTYDQISSVEVVNENRLIVHAGGSIHKIYIMKAREIRDAIMAQKAKIG